MTPAPARRILHVTQPTEAGVARCVLEFATAQARSGSEVVVACPPSGWLPTRLSDAQRGVRIAPWPAARAPGPSTARETLALRRIVSAVDPDLVHLHAAKAGLAGRLAVRGSRPTVFQPHAWSFDAVTGPVRLGATSWERMAVRWTTVLVCVSGAERERGAASGVRVDPTVVVPNGVDLAQYPAASSDDRSRARRRLALPDAPLCVCVGRLARQKGQDLLLAIWPEVRAQVPDAELVLVGDGPDRDEMARLATPGVTFVGDRSDVPDWMAAANVVVAPSRWEGMALVPLEAMARGRSVVVSDVTGMREALPAGAGAVVAPADTAALTAALVARLTGASAADDEGRVGRLHVVRHHDVAETVAGLERAYRLALAG